MLDFFVHCKDLNLLSLRFVSAPQGIPYVYLPALCRIIVITIVSSIMSTYHSTFYTVLFSFQLLRVLAVSPDAQCFTGNGTLSTDFPCKTSENVGFCCGVGWSCLSNGLCQWRDSTSFAEGTCTDKTFPANSCLGLCLASMFFMEHLRSV